jgi:hypothetical protein
MFTPLLAIFRLSSRELKFLLYNVRPRVGEISTSGFITNFFRKTDIRITMRTNNTLHKLLMLKPQSLDKYSRSTAYKLTCPDCNNAYIGQTGRASHKVLKSIKMHLGPTETLQPMPNTL